MKKKEKREYWEDWEEYKRDIKDVGDRLREDFSELAELGKRFPRVKVEEEVIKAGRKEPLRIEFITVQEKPLRSMSVKIGSIALIISVLGLVLALLLPWWSYERDVDEEFSGKEAGSYNFRLEKMSKEGEIQAPENAFRGGMQDYYLESISLAMLGFILMAMFGVALIVTGLYVKVNAQIINGVLSLCLVALSILIIVPCARFIGLATAVMLSYDEVRIWTIAEYLLLLYGLGLLGLGIYNADKEFEIFRKGRNERQRALRFAEFSAIALIAFSIFALTSIPLMPWLIYTNDDEIHLNDACIENNWSTRMYDEYNATANFKDFSPEIGSIWLIFLIILFLSLSAFLISGFGKENYDSAGSMLIIGITLFVLSIASLLTYFGMLSHIESFNDNLDSGKIAFSSNNYTFLISLLLLTLSSLFIVTVTFLFYSIRKRVQLEKQRREFARAEFEEE